MMYHCVLGYHRNEPLAEQHIETICFASQELSEAWIDLIQRDEDYRVSPAILEDLPITLVIAADEEDDHEVPCPYIETEDALAAFVTERNLDFLRSLPPLTIDQNDESPPQ